MAMIESIKVLSTNYVLTFKAILTVFYTFFFGQTYYWTEI
jgi:hypothetical protein